MAKKKFKIEKKEKELTKEEMKNMRGGAAAPDAENDNPPAPAAPEAGYKKVQQPGRKLL